MKILLVCMEFDYGDPRRGRSYEYYNFFETLVAEGHDVTLYDYMTELKALGRAAMNAKLLELARAMKPDVAIFSLYTDQFDPQTVDALRAVTTTFCFFHDDTWRIDYSRFWARHFDYFSTPDVYGERKYAAIGLRNALHFPFGCNEKRYCELADTPLRYDVAFVGGWHPYRAWLIRHLRRAGIAVEVAGHGWPAGIISHEGMVRRFNESRINLNLSNSQSWDARYLVSSPRAILSRIRSRKNVEQLKARHFEINGCGGFQLSYYVEGLERYYEIGTEIAVYVDPDDLVEKIRTYLADDAWRSEIARAGRQRTLRDHTFSMRFRRIFAQMGLANG